MLRVILTLLLSFSWLQAQPYGMNERPAFSAYNGGKLPAVAPRLTGLWSTTPAFPNLTFINPMGITQLPGASTMVVWEREGRVYSFAKERSASSKTLMLDISSKVQGWDDCGLLGLAFHPNYASNGYVFLYYTYAATGEVRGDMNNRPPVSIQGAYHDRLVRYTVNAQGVMDPATETIFVDQVANCVFHNGGGLFFHPNDGFLYWSDGDDEAGSNSQTITSGLLGGVFRIDVDCRGGSVSHAPLRSPNPAGSVTQNYYIPNDNPFVGQRNALEEFFCLGLRSPHRMTLDATTGRIYIGDVGAASREEIDVIARGESGLNFQWDHLEGLNGHIDGYYLGVDREPLFDYPHSGGEGCIIGGYVYRGSEFPQLVGRYIFGDNLTGHLYYLNEASYPPTRVYMGDLPFGPGPNSGYNYTGLSSFGEDADHELYLCQLSSTGGKIYKLTANPENEVANADEKEGWQVTDLPATLRETGLLSDLHTVTPSGGFVAYDVNTPLWSDGAQKQRWFAIPTGSTIGYAPTGEWTFPNGSVFLKHFELPYDARNPGLTRRLETRVLVRDDSGHVYGASYKWRLDQSDADLVSDTALEEIPTIDINGVAGTQTWTYPGRQDCVSCHTPASGGVLGLKTKQNHRDHDFSGVTDNQLRAWNHVGYFSPSIDEATLPELTRLVSLHDPSASVEQRMRSYLDANCSHCHRPAGVRALWDARIETPLADAGIVNGVVADNLGWQGGQVLTPGIPRTSIMLYRLAAVNSPGISYAMPPLAKHLVDEDAVALLRTWIDQLQPVDPPGLPSPWQHQDIGDVGTAGTATYSGGTFSVQGSGSDIWNDADSFHFVYRDLSGDGSLTARVITQSYTAEWAKAGVMIRETLANDSRHVMNIVTPAQGVTQQGRDVTGGQSYMIQAYNESCPLWVRIERRGNTFITHHSLDGETWTESGRRDIPMQAQVKIGLCVGALSYGTLNVAGFDQVQFIDSSSVGIVGQPRSTLARVGEPVVFDVGLSGIGPSYYQWQLDGVAINGAVTDKYLIGSVTLNDVGEYRILVGPDLVSNPASLAVVGDISGETILAMGQSLLLSVPFAGEGITFRWSRNNVPLVDSSTVYGAATHAIRLDGFGVNDQGDYSCTATAFGQSKVIGPVNVRPLRIPEITSAGPLAGIVSSSFLWQLESDQPQTSFRVSGLPDGLSYDAQSRAVVGVPNCAGDYPIQVVPVNPAGSGTMRAYLLHVAPLPPSLAGRYTAVVEINPVVNAGLGGWLDLTMTNAGFISGRLFNSSLSYSLAGRVLVGADQSCVYLTTVDRGSLGDLNLSLAIDPVSGFLRGTASVKGDVCAVTGRRQGVLVAGYLDYPSLSLNVALRLQAPAFGDLTQPQGSGWLRLLYTVQSGILNAVGSAADGNALTFGGVVGTDLSVPIRFLTKDGAASLQGMPRLSQPLYPVAPDRAALTASGSLTWVKQGRLNPQDYGYQKIQEVLSFDGARFLQLSSQTLLGNPDAANNARLIFSGAAGSLASQMTNSSQLFRLTLAGQALFAKQTGSASGISLNFDSTTGLFTGNLLLNCGTRAVSVPMQGVIVNQVGRGFFLLPDQPLVKTSPVYSGSLELRAAP